jgi:hypothetical protein
MKPVPSGTTESSPGRKSWELDISPETSPVRDGREQPRTQSWEARLQSCRKRLKICRALERVWDLRFFPGVLTHALPCLSCPLPNFSALTSAFPSSHAPSSAPEGAFYPRHCPLSEPVVRFRRDLDTAAKPVPQRSVVCSRARHLCHPLTGGTRHSQGRGPRNPTSAKTRQIWGTRHLLGERGGSVEVPAGLCAVPIRQAQGRLCGTRS